MEYQVVCNVVAKDFGEETPGGEDVLAEINVPDNAESVDIKCKSMSPPLIAVSYLIPKGD